MVDFDEGSLDGDTDSIEFDQSWYDAENQIMVQEYRASDDLTAKIATAGITATVAIAALTNQASGLLISAGAVFGAALLVSLLSMRLAALRMKLELDEYWDSFYGSPEVRKRLGTDDNEVRSKRVKALVRAVGILNWSSLVFLAIAVVLLISSLGSIGVDKLTKQ